LKEEALGRTIQSTRFGREYGLSSDKLRDDDYAFKIFGTGMRKIYAEITKKIEKKIRRKFMCFGRPIKPSHDLLQCGEFRSFFGHADKKNILLLEHQSVHYALCSMKAATQAKAFFNL